jgi:XTP/dITP diphosphohydrolase
MKRKMIAATGNAQKMVEIRQILAGFDMELVTMAEAGLDLDIVENGSTFVENALIKARAVAQASGEMAIADDSGLVVDAMDGAPGIHSARWMGHDTSYEIKNREIIRLVDAFCAAKEARAKGTGEEIQRIHPGCLPDGTPGPLRSARFVCAVAVAWPDGRQLTAEGTLEGRIHTKACGENGFGYDPIFYLPEYGMTSGQIPREEKNRISHRGKAFRKMQELLREMIP